MLIGGLGMGFTARAALDALRRDAQVTIAELVPEVVAWNREHLGDLARRPLDDPRVTVEIGDVAAAIGERRGVYTRSCSTSTTAPTRSRSPANAALYGSRA